MPWKSQNASFLLSFFLFFFFTVSLLYHSTEMHSLKQNMNSIRVPNINDLCTFIIWMNTGCSNCYPNECWLFSQDLTRSDISFWLVVLSVFFGHPIVWRAPAADSGTTTQPKQLNSELFYFSHLACQIQCTSALFLLRQKEKKRLTSKHRRKKIEKGGRR